MRELDNRTIGAGKRGPITAAIQARFFELVGGKLPEHDNWLHYV